MAGRLLVGPLVAVLAGCAATPAPSAPAVPAFDIRRAPSAITVDGDLSDPAWKNAVAVPLVLTVDGGVPKHPTYVRLLYDDTNLYIAFEVADTHPWNRYTKRDEPIYEDEVVEAFLCPSNHLHYYYEFQVGPHNVVFDAFIINRGGPDGMGKTVHAPPLTQYTADGLQTAVRIRGGKADSSVDGTEKAEGWDVELAVPFASISGGPNLPPKPGDVWRGNLYRIERPTKSSWELQALSPTGAADYHRPGKFAILRFAP